ncbi:hypothetical protein LCGC14_0738440 [marine sediment metagenome]|uniref:Uncharacterized protein n=1 Tax=marine sediment metagenome TaxID=412755 RepID=A0A0F9TEP9_9ZZZZ
MAIRLRIIDGTHVALCAAHSDLKSGDIYLDDAWHYAISQKYWRDYPELGIVDEENNAIARKECRCPACHPQTDR